MSAQSTIDFREKLKEQLEFIHNSAVAYDNGKLHEAIRIATSLRVLFHDTNSSTSLCRHLGKSKLMLASTPSADSGAGDMYFGLTGMRSQIPATLSRSNGKIDMSLGEGSGKLLAYPLGLRPNWSFVNFDRWWRKETIIRFRQTKAVRRDLVLSAANKDGGAHVDTKYDAKYAEIAAGFRLSMFVKVGSGPVNPETDYKVDFSNPHLAAIRQMAYEILNSPELRI